jgi:dephospho-CoA kinase
MRKALIGLVGHPSSGKDTVAAYLVERHNFVHVSTGDLIRAYVTEHNMGGLDRDTLRVVSTTLREEHGADFFTQMALKNDSPYLVISGPRAIREAGAVQDAGGLLLACTAPIEVRYARVGERGRIGDGVSFEKFREQEEAEASSTNPESQNVSAVLKMADHIINNTGSLEDLQNSVEEFLKKHAIVS